MKFIQKYAVIAMTSAMVLQADTVKVYNGSNQPVAVAIVQGSKSKKTGQFEIDLSTIKGKNKLSAKKVMVYTVGVKEVAEVPRPRYSPGNDTMLLLSPSSDALAADLESNDLSRANMFKVGQIRNKKVFLGKPVGITKVKPLAPFNWPSPGEHVKRGVALWGSYKDLVRADASLNNFNEQWQNSSENPIEAEVGSRLRSY